MFTPKSFVSTVLFLFCTQAFSLDRPPINITLENAKHLGVSITVAELGYTDQQLGIRVSVSKETKHLESVGVSLVSDSFQIPLFVGEDSNGTRNAGFCLSPSLVKQSRVILQGEDAALGNAPIYIICLEQFLPKEEDDKKGEP